MTNARVLLLLREDSPYGGEPSVQRATDLLVASLQERGAHVDRRLIAMDRPETFAPLAAEASRYDLVVARIGYAGHRELSIHALFQALEDAGARYMPRLHHLRSLGSKTAVHALASTALGCRDVELVDGERALSAAVARVLDRHPSGCVVKARFGSGGREVFHVERGSSPRSWWVTCAYDGARVERSPHELAQLAHLATSQALVMPYLEGIRRGELRFYFLRDELLPACLLKRSSSGGFSVARGLGGTRDMVEVPYPEARSWPAMIAPPLGLRDLPVLWSVDVIADEHDRPIVSETNVLNVGLRPLPPSFIASYAAAILANASGEERASPVEARRAAG